MDLDFYIENCIIPQYAAFDDAHNIEHVTRVIDVSLQLAAEYDVNPIMCYVIAAYHDLGLPQGRATHHLTSAHILRDDKALRNWCSETNINIMAEAIEDHRASAENPPRSIYGAIVAEADRDLRPEVPLRRTIQYGLSHYPNEDYEFHKQRTIEHLTEKYGRNGYLKLPLNSRINLEGLEQLRQIIESPDLFNQKFNEIWKQLTSK
jgi:uncharacterized protein